MDKPKSTYSDLRQRLATIYALLIGVAGVLNLVWLLQYQTMSFDLLALIPFALLSILVSYFRVPVGHNNAELSIDGAILLGAMLTGGPVIGGWAAFITGLVLSIHPPTRPPSSIGWMDQIVLSALNSGRYVIATGTAWIIFYWLGGTLTPSRLTPVTIIALILMSIVYVLTRLALIRLFTLFAGSRPFRSFLQPVNADQFLVELLPLPLALAFSPFFVRFVWTRFLTLSLIFIGNGLLLHYLKTRIQNAQDQIETLRLRQQAEQAFNKPATSTDTLSGLAHRFCQQIVQSYCEIGILNATMTQVQVDISTDLQTRHPSMYIPTTSMWTWIGNLQAPQLLSTPEEFQELPFSLPYLSDDAPPRTALLLPIHAHEAIQVPLGGIILLSEKDNAFERIHIERLTLIAELLGIALQRIRENPFVAEETEQTQVVRHIQQTLLPPHPPTWPGWQVGYAWTFSPLPGGIWFDWQEDNEGWTFCLAEPVGAGLRSALLATATRALVQTHPSQTRRDPNALLHDLNAYLIGFGQQARCMYIVNESKHLLTWVNAGFPDALWWHHAQGRVEMMPTTAPELGTDPDIQVETTTIALEEGDAFIIYTPGILHNSQPPDALFKRLSELVRESASLAAGELAQTIVEQIAPHNTPQQDALVIVFKAMPG